MHSKSEGFWGVYPTTENPSGSIFNKATEITFRQPGLRKY
jgi:hypothetical protein